MLPDEEKTLTRDEIVALAKEQKEAIAALTVAKLELKAEVADLLAKQQEALGKHGQALQEVALYKWLARVILVFVFGGSLWGILKYQEVIDSRIALRTIKADRLNLALSLANSNQWREALSEISAVWSDMKSAGNSVSPDYRSFVLRNLLLIISQVEDVLPDGSFVGEIEWLELNKNPDFQREFITGNRWANDDTVNHSIAFCVLKFNRTPEVLTIAQTYLQQAINSTTREQRKAPRLFALAMIDLIKNHQPQALERLREAERLDPSEYLIGDLIPYKNSFINSPEFKIWQQVARRVRAKPFETLYEDLLRQIKK